MKKYMIFALFILTQFNINAQCDKLSVFASSGSGQTGTSEAISKAFDGDMKTKWSDNATVKYLDLIFDEPVEICKVVIYHAQAGGESASLNTSDYRILSYKNSGWINQLTVTQNTAGTTTHELSPFTTTVLRLQIDKAAQSNNDQSRIYELEVYGKVAGATENVTYLKRIYPLQVTGSSQTKDSEGMIKAFDGNYETKWCATNSGEKWLDIIVKRPIKLEKMIVHHAGEGENTAKWNTKKFKLQADIDGNYQDIISETDNALNVSSHTYTGNISANKMRFLISQGEQNANSAARIFEIELYAKYETPAASSSVEEGRIYEIFPYISDKILSVENSSSTNSARICNYTRSDVNSQRWKAVISGGKLAFQNVYSGLYLSSTGSEVIARTGINTTAQWTLVPVEGETNCFYLTNTTGKYVRTPADIEGFPVTFRDKSSSPYEKGEIWRFVEVEATSNKFTAGMRDEMVNDWKDKFYLPATFNPTFKVGSTAVGHVIERPGFWDTAENMEIILDAYETTQRDEFRVMYNEIFDNFKATQYLQGWAANDFNDDLAWLVIGMVRAHLLFGDQSRNYKALAKEYFDLVYNRALLSDGECIAGLLRWKQGNRSTNSCVNGPMEVAACYLAMATGDDSYYTKAKDVYELHRKYLTKLPDGVGQVYDSWNCSNNSYNYWSSTYNQGTFLGAAVMLYKRYGDTYNGKSTTYKDDAQKVMTFTMGSYFCDNGIIKVCTNGTDLAGFKGILMRYVRKYYEEIPGVDVDTYKNWMMKNAFHAYNNRNSQGLAWTNWLKRSDENNYSPYMDNGKVVYEAFGAFGTGTAVSVAVNIPFKSESNKIDKVEKQSSITSALVGKHLFISSSLDEPLQAVNIFDTQGKKICSMSDINVPNSDFDLQGINNAVIIVRVQTKSHVETVKLLIK